MPKSAVFLFTVALFALASAHPAHAMSVPVEAPIASPLYTLQAIVANLVSGAERIMASIETGLVSITTAATLENTRLYTASAASAPFASADANVVQSSPPAQPNAVPSPTRHSSASKPKVAVNFYDAVVSPAVNVFAVQNALDELSTRVQALSTLVTSQQNEQTSVAIEMQLAALQAAASAHDASYYPLGDGTGLSAVSNIGQLSGVTITNANLSASEIPALDYLSLGGGTLGGDLQLDGDATTTGSSYFTGSVGIGTTTGDALAVNGSAYLADITPPTTTANRLYSNGGSLYWAGSVISSAGTGHWTTDGTNVWRAGGDVGIGTSSPFTSLSVVGNGYFTGSLTAASSTLGNATSTTIFSSVAYFTTGVVGTLNTSIANIAGFTATNATTTNLAIASVPSGLLSTNANGVVRATTILGPLSLSGNTLSIAQANGSANGFLASTDWTNFNGKLGSSTISSLTTNSIAKWTGTAFANSLITDTGTAIGIGTTSPTAILTIDSSNVNGTAIRLSNSSGGGHIFDLMSTGSGNTGGAGRLDFFDTTAGLARLSIAANGNLGVGTTTPGSVFSINGVANWTAATSSLYSAGGINLAGGCFAIASNCIGLANLSGVLSVSSGGTGTTTWQTGSIPFFNGATFSENNANLFWNSTTNSLGIGTTAPTATLDVNGTLTTTGTASFANAVPSPDILRSDLNPDVDLAKLEATSTPIVCAIGDSTVSNGNYVAPIDSQYSKIQAALRSKYPTKSFTFKDFSIGGSTLTQFTTVLSANWPSWYTNHSATWSSYVSAAGCTTLLISYGLNDTGYQAASTWATALAAITSFPTIPDIIISTNIVANPAAGSPYSTAAYQAGYLANAALQRTIALSGNTLGVSNLPPIGILDIGRYFNMAVFGRDPAEQTLSTIIPSTSPVIAGITGTGAFNYTLPTSTDGDFDLSVSVTNGSSWQSSGTIMTIGLFDSQGGSGTGIAVGSVHVLTNNSTTFYTQPYYSNSSTYIPASASNWNSATNTIEVSLQAGHLRVIANGTVTLDQLIPAAETSFVPWVNITTPPNGTTVTINSYAAGKMRAYTPLLSQSVCYGSTSGADSGNGINHVSSDCLNAVYEPVIESALRSGMNDPTYTGTIGQNAYFGGLNTLIGTSSLFTSISGNVGIGTTTPYSRLEAWGTDTASTSAFAVVNSASTTEFSVLDNGNATLAGNLIQSSDQRLKTNIETLDGSSSLAEIDNLNPVTFNWIDPQKNSVPQFGFIAQDVQKVFPNLVSISAPTALTPDGTLSLNYIDLISPIISAVQELDKEIKSLESTVSGFAQSITSAVGNFGQVNANQLCLGSTCVTQVQLQALLAAANQTSSASASLQSSPSTATNTPPVIQVNGSNPAIIQVGATYNDPGATLTGPQADLNLGIQTYLNGTLESPITLDTSAPATDTIGYFVVDAQGLSSTSTRTVVVEPTNASSSSLRPFITTEATSSEATTQ